MLASRLMSQQIELASTKAPQRQFIKMLRTELKLLEKRDACVQKQHNVTVTKTKALA